MLVLNTFHGVFVHMWTPKMGVYRVNFLLIRISHCLRGLKLDISSMDKYLFLDYEENLMGKYAGSHGDPARHENRHFV